MGANDGEMDPQALAAALEAFTQLRDVQPNWKVKEQQLMLLNELLDKHPQEASEAALLAGPSLVVDSIMALLIGRHVQLSSKLQAADLLSVVCCDVKASLLLSPGFIVERLMRCHHKGDSDSRSAAARALWQLSCHNDFSPEVVSHAGHAFKVVDLLAEDMQQGSSTACMCAMRATQHLLHTYASSGTGDAGDRIGGRVIQPLCNLLEPSHPEPAAAAAELLALLSQTAQNRARILAAGGIPRLISLMRHASTGISSCSSGSGVCGDDSPESSPTAGGPSRQQRQAATEAAAEAAISALAQMASGDAKLCSELLGAQVVPGLLQILQNRGSCCAAALSLLGDLAALPEGRRALQNTDGFAVLAEVAQDCPKQQLCRLLSKVTKSSNSSALTSPSAQELAGLASSSALVSVLVHCCRPIDRKTRKRAMQVLLRLLEFDRLQAVHMPLQLQQQLRVQVLSMGLLPHIHAVLAAQHGPGHAGSSLLEVQLAVGLLQEVADCQSIITGLAVGTAATITKVADLQDMPADDILQQQDQGDMHPQQQEHPCNTTARQSAAAAAMLAAPHLIWKHPVAAAAAFGDLKMLLQPGIAAGSGHDSSSSSSPSGFASAEAAELWTNLLWQLQQLLLSRNPPSLQQQVLQVVSEIAGHRHPGLLQLMVKQGWVQVLWSFLPGGRQLLAVVMSQLMREQQQQQQQAGEAESVKADNSINPVGGSMHHATTSSCSNFHGLAVRGGMHAPPTAPAVKSSNLHPHLLQLLDESLPSLEHTLHALQALAHLCCQASAAAVAVQLQVSYTAAAAAGLVALHPAADSSTAAESAAVAMLFGSAGSLGSTPHALHHMTQVRAGSSLPQSPRHLPATPRSVASTSSSGTSTTSGSHAAAGHGSSGNSGGGSSSLVRASSSGLLSRLGLKSSNSSSTQQSHQLQHKPATAAGDAAGRLGSDLQPGKPSAGLGVGAMQQQLMMSSELAATGQEPVEDPGSPMAMLVTLLGEQWAATAAAELLAHICAANPAACVPAALEQGVATTLCSCMQEIQENQPGAVAALATLKLAAEVGRHCMDALAAAGIVPVVLRMLVFGHGAIPSGAAALQAGVGGMKGSSSATAHTVQCAALRVLVVVCTEGDRQCCAAVAKALLLLVRWLHCGTAAQAGDAATILAALLDAGVVDGCAVDAAVNDEERTAELLRLCLKCLPAAHASQEQQEQQVVGISDAGGITTEDGGATDGADKHCKPQQQQQQQQQQQVHLTAVRLLCQCVQLDSRFASALLSANGLPVLVDMLSAAAAAAASTASGSVTALTYGSSLLTQFEVLKVLDSLSLVHRLELVKANIVPIIVGVLRQKSPAALAQQQASAASAGPTAGTAEVDSAAAVSAPGSTAGVLAAPAAQHTLSRGNSSSSSNLQLNWSRSLSRLPSSRAQMPSTSSSGSGGNKLSLPLEGTTAAMLLTCSKEICCNLITVLAINNDVKRQLFHADAVGPLMQMAEVVEEGSRTQEAIKAALAQLGLIYLLPSAAGVM